MTNVSYSRDAAAGTSRTQTKSAAVSAVAWPTADLWTQTVTAISDPDFITVTIFCAIGLLATANLMLNGFVIATL
jgi:hypothetical protein